MKIRFFTITAKAIVFVIAFVLVQSCKKNDSNAGCNNPNFTASVNSSANFNACGAYAYEVMNNYSIIGNSENDWITIGFLTSDQSKIVPGTYQVNNGVTLPSGQSFIVDVVYKEDGTDLAHTYLSTSGTLVLTEASSTHYKGTFTTSALQMQGSATRTLSASFDVNFQ